MREIRFRAWTEFKKMVDVSTINFATSEALMPDGRWYKVELMQYTGLLDRNGTEIYEGDVLHEYEEVVDSWRNDNSKDYAQDQVHEVRYLTGNNDDGFRCVSQPTEYYTGDDYYTTWIKPETMEVIGNVYEAPELLTSTEVPSEHSTNGKLARRS